MAKTEYEDFFKSLQVDLEGMGLGADEDVNGADLVDFMNRQLQKMQEITLKNALFSDAYGGLKGYSPGIFLSDREGFYREKVLDGFSLTGNNQFDYEKLRDKIESVFNETHVNERKAFKDAKEIINAQGWNLDSQLININGFVGHKGLVAELAQYFVVCAKEENDDADEVSRDGEGSR